MSKYDKKMGYCFYSGVIVGNRIFTQNTFSLWMMIDINTGTIDLLEDITGYFPTKQKGEPQYLIEYRNVLFAVDTYCENIIEYNLQTNNCTNHRISMNKYEKVFLAKEDEYIYIYPCSGNRVFSFHMDSKRVIEEKRTGDMVDFIFSAACQNGYNIFFAGEKDIIKFNIKTKQEEKYCIPIEIGKCIDIVCDNSALYLLNESGMVFKWDMEKDEFVIIREEQGKLHEYGSIICTEKYIWILPCLGEKIVKISLENTKNQENVPHPEKFQYYAPENWTKYGKKIETETDIFVPCHSSNYILQINKKNQCEKWIEVKGPSPKKMLAAWRKNEQMFVENMFRMSLVDLLELNNDIACNEEKTKISNGNKIWDYLK